MTSEPRTKVRVTHRFSASPERVFDAFLDPEKAGKFMFATETGQMVRVEIDARVGGKFCFTDRRDGEDVAHTGEYLQIDRLKQSAGLKRNGRRLSLPPARPSESVRNRVTGRAPAPPPRISA